MTTEPRNLLVIHFGQLGDVILGLPALGAISERFPNAKRSILVGSACAEIARMCGFFDEVIPLDRVKLLKSNKAWSSIQILKFAREIRRKRFDLVIDLHSLPETNLLGYISGARQRLYANRESRSLDRLSNFRPKPPQEDKTRHLSLVYMDVLQPLGGRAEFNLFRMQPDESDLETLRSAVSSNLPVVGINPGAGHQSRRWDIEKFVELANDLVDETGIKVVFFLGPEEASIKNDLVAASAGRWTVVDGLTLPQLAAAFSLLNVLVGNDTGPMHLAGAVGTSLVMLAHEAAPDRYFPISENLTVVRGREINEISVDQVIEAVKASLSPSSDSPK